MTNEYIFTTLFSEFDIIRLLHSSRTLYYLNYTNLHVKGLPNFYGCTCVIYTTCGQVGVNINIYFYLGILEQLNFSPFVTPRRHSFPRLNKLDLLRDPEAKTRRERVKVRKDLEPSGIWRNECPQIMHSSVRRN